VAWSRWPREGRWLLCLREGKDRRCLAWIESRDEEVLSDLFLSAVWGGSFSLVLAGYSNPAETGGKNQRAELLRVEEKGVCFVGFSPFKRASAAVAGRGGFRFFFEGNGGLTESRIRGLERLQKALGKRVRGGVLCSLICFAKVQGKGGEGRRWFRWWHLWFSSFGQGKGAAFLGFQRWRLQRGSIFLGFSTFFCSPFKIFLPP